MSAPIPRFLLPRGYTISYTALAIPVKTPQRVYRTLPTCRNASTSSSKPRVLEKPTKFNPPSHGKRLKQQVPRHYGPQLTTEQKRVQQTKKYPNMMPAPGTFMHSFLTNRSVHTFISLGILVLLAFITAFENWRRATAFREQLPAPADFLSQPITAFWQMVEVYRLEVAKTSAETAEKRRRGVEDVQKRNTYRIAHGLQAENSAGLGGWTARSDEETSGSGAKVDEAVGRPVGVEPGQEVEAEAEMEGRDRREGPVVWEGRKRTIKKWFGIW